MSQFDFLRIVLKLILSNFSEPLLDRHIIDWESRPDSVAHQNGLVLAFSSNLIEIRDASNGRLRQVISGKEIRMTCDGSVVDHERNLQVSMNVNGFHTIFELVSM